MGNFTAPAQNVPLRIDRNLTDLPAVGLVRPKASFPALYSLDGIIDDLKIYDRSLAQKDVAAEYKLGEPVQPPDLPERHWPPMTSHAGHLSAVYTSLKLYPEWDALWRTGPYSDVVVTFPSLPFHYVFWRGANFGPNLVTENGIWIGDQSFEASTKIGTAEHMNDKHDIYSHITIVESSPARVVLHWRYALADVKGNIADVDPVTGWGDWADEFFYLYPDSLAVRYGTVHGTRSKYSFTEPTLLLAPGTKPEAYISLKAVTIANQEGQSRTYDWELDPPASPFPGQPTGSNIAIMNLKSTFKPFYIYRPGTVLGPYGWPPEERPLYSHFPVWDHWPVNQIPSDGRFALFPNHFGSAAIMSPNVNSAWIANTADSKSAIFLFGLTNETVSELARLDESWLHPAELQTRTDKLTGTYDPTERAYWIDESDAPESRSREITFTLNASSSSPVVNPAFVIENWGESSPKVLVNGQMLRQDQFAAGYRHRLEGTDLILWIKQDSNDPIKIEVVFR